MRDEGRVGMEFSEREFHEVYSAYRANDGPAWHQDAALREKFLVAARDLSDQACAHEKTIQMYEDDVWVGTMCRTCGMRNP